METNRIEYKQQLTKFIEKEVIAFLNYKEGGLLYIGLQDNGDVIGVQNIDETALVLKDKFKNNISPSALGLFDIVVEEKENKYYIKVIVASGTEKPYYYTKYGMTPKGCFERIGTSAEPMLQTRIDNLFSKRTRNSISKIAAPVQKLSFSQLKIYYQGIDIELPNKFAKNLELLTQENNYNYVGYLVSDLNNISIKVAKYSSNDRSDLIESNEYGYESIVKATFQVLNKFELENTTLTKITSKQREQKRLFNAIAMREAIINAFVHNDYSREVSPKFELFANRIEITSAGGLPEGLNEDEFFDGYSVPRNKELIRIYKDLKLVEQLGSGIPRILKYYPKENFKFTDNFIRMTFPFEEDLIGGLKGGLIEDLKDVSDRQKELLKLLNGNPFLSKSKLSNIIGINESAIQKHLQTLKNKGHLQRKGGKKGEWKVVVKHQKILTEHTSKINENLGGSIGGLIGGSINELQDVSDKQKELLTLLNNDGKLSKEKLSKTIKMNKSAIQKHLNTLREKGYLKRIGGTRGEWKVIIENE